MPQDTLKEDQDKKPYEVSFLVRNEEQAQDARRLLQQHNLEVKEESPLRKLSLSYPIENLEQAIFGFFHVLAYPTDIKLLEKDIKGSKNVLRSLIISLEAKASRRIERAPREFSPASRKPIAQKESDTRSLSNEAIEKKIEEILQ